MVKLFEGVLPDVTAVFDFGELAGISVADEAVRVVVDQSTSVFLFCKQVIVLEFGFLVPVAYIEVPDRPGNYVIAMHFDG